MTGNHEPAFQCQNCSYTAIGWDAAITHVKLSSHAMGKHKHNYRLVAVQRNRWSGDVYLFHCRICLHHFSEPIWRFWNEKYWDGAL